MFRLLLICQQMLLSQLSQLSPSLRSLRPAASVAFPARRCATRLHVVAFREQHSQQQLSDWDSRRASKQRSSTSDKQAKRDFLEARQVSLYELFDGSAFLLDVPEYQRPYAWRQKQVGWLCGPVSGRLTAHTHAEMQGSRQWDALLPLLLQAGCCQGLPGL